MTFVSRSCKPRCYNATVASVDSMSPLTDSTDVITVTHGGPRGEKEALRKHLKLFTIQPILHKYLMQRRLYCVHTLHKLQTVVVVVAAVGTGGWWGQGGGGEKCVALWGVWALLSGVEI